MQFLRAHLACLVALTLPALPAADDPYETLDPAANIACLLALDHDLGTAPATDPRLITAEMALVDLALNGDQRDRGGHGGIWRQRARELRDLRRQAGVTPKTFHDAVPDLWVDALDGCSAACLAALATYQVADADQPQAAALRCYATGDWRQLSKQLCGPHERAALDTAYFRAGMAMALDAQMDNGVPPTFGDCMLDDAVNLNDVHHAGESSAKALRLALQAVARLAVAPDLPPACAPLADALAVDVHLPASATSPAERGPALAAAFATGENYLDHNATRDAWLLTTAAATAGPTGLRGPDGAWHLAAPGDRAIAARLDLGMVMWLLTANFQGDEASNRSSGIKDADPVLYGPWFTYQRSFWQDQSAATATIAGIRAEIPKGPAGVPPMRLAGMLDRIVILREQDDQAIPAVADLAAAQAAAEPGRGAGWATVGELLYKAGLLNDTHDGVAAAAAADPWSPELAELVAMVGKERVRATDDNPLMEVRADDAVLADLCRRMPWRIDLLAKRAQSLCAAQRWADALPLIEGVLAIAPDDQRVGALHGDCLHGLGRNDEAIAAWTGFQPHDRSDQPWLVPISIAHAYDEAGRFEDADRWFQQATHWGDPDSALAYADFLVERGRGREASARIEQATIPWVAHLHLRAARVLIEPANANAADADDAFALIRANREQLLSPSREVHDLCRAIRAKSLDRRFLALADDAWHGCDNALRGQVGVMLIVTGHPVQGARWMAEERASYPPRQLGVAWCATWETLAARLAKRPDLAPSADDLRAELGSDPDMDPILGHLLGDLDRAKTLAAAARDDHDTRLYLAIAAAANGDTAQARTDLAALIAEFPATITAGDARCLLAVLDGGKAPTPPDATPSASAPAPAAGPLETAPAATPAHTTDF